MLDLVPISLKQKVTLPAVPVQQHYDTKVLTLWWLQCGVLNPLVYCNLWRTANCGVLKISRNDLRKGKKVITKITSLVTGKYDKIIKMLRPR